MRQLACHAVRSLLVALFALCGAGALAQEGPVNTTPIGEDYEVEGLIERIDKNFQAKGEWDRVGRAFQKLIESEKESPYSSDGRLYIPLYKYCHQKVAAFPAVGLAKYRELYDAQARNEFDKGLKDLDLEPLSKVRRYFFCTSIGDEALDLMARILMDQGSFSRAARVLNELHPLRPGTGLAYPDPNVPLGPTLVRMAICYAELGENDLVREILERIRAEQTFSDRQLETRFEQYLVARMQGREAAPTAGDFREEWPTAYGDYARTNLTSGGKLLLDPIEWKYPVTGDRSSGVEEYRNIFNTLSQRGNGRRQLTPAVLPVVRGNRVFVKVKDSEPLVAIDLYNGKLKWKGRQEKDPQALASRIRWGGGMNITSDFLYAWRFFGDYAWSSLSSHDDYLFSIENNFSQYYRDIVRAMAAMGVPMPTDAELGNQIVVYQISTQGKLKAVLGGPDAGVDHLKKARFLSAPAVGHGLLVAPAQVEEDYFLYAFSLRDFTFQWRTLVCSRTANITNPYYGGQPILLPPEGGHLSIGEGTAYWVSGNGIVAAVDLATGGKEWLVRYPHEETPQQQPTGWDINHGWDPSPPILTEGRLLVAPVDSNFLFCLDAATGAEKWRADRTHRQNGKQHAQTILLGVRDGIVYTAGDGVIARYLQDGWHGQGDRRREHAGGGVRWVAWPQAIGRGLLTEESLFLPSIDRGGAEGIYKIEMAGGRVREFLAAPGGAGRAKIGNLLLVGGVLISASAEEIVAFDSIGLRERRLMQLTRRVEADPTDHEARFERGTTLIDLGKFDEGMAEILEAHRLAEAAGSRKVRRIAREIYTRRLARARISGDEAEFEAARRFADTDEERLQVDLVRAETIASDRPAEALQVYLGLFDARSTGTHDMGPELSVSIRHYLSTRIRELIDASDETAAVLDEYLAPIREAIAAGEMPEDLAGRLSTLPFSLLTPDLRRALAEDHLERGTFLEAVPYLDSLTGPDAHPIAIDDDPTALWALIQLVEGYEKVGNRARAADYLARIRDSHGETRLGGGPEGPGDHGDDEKADDQEGEEKADDQEGDEKADDQEGEEKAGDQEGEEKADDQEGEGDDGGQSGSAYFEAKTAGGAYAAYFDARAIETGRVSAAGRLTQAWQLDDAVLAGSRLIGSVPGKGEEAYFLVQTPRGDSSAGLQCRRASDGKIVWASPFLALDRETRNRTVYADFLINPEIRLGPTWPSCHRIADQIIVCLENGAYAFHATGGKLRWSIEVPAPDYDTLFARAGDLTDYDKRLVQQRINTIQWDRVYFPNAMVGDLLIVYRPDGELIALRTNEIETGTDGRPHPKTAWKQKMSLSRWNQILVDGDRVVFIQRPLAEGDTQKTIVTVIDSFSGKVVSRHEPAPGEREEEKKGIQGRGAQLTDSGLVVFPSHGAIHAYDVRRGTWAWTRRPEGAKVFSGMLALGSGWIGAYRKSGELYLIEAETGIDRWVASIGVNRFESILAATVAGDQLFLALGEPQQFHNPLESTYMWNRTYQQAKIHRYDLDSDQSKGTRDFGQGGRLYTLAWMDLLPVEGGVLAFAASYQSNSNWVGVLDERLNVRQQTSVTANRGTRFVNDPRRALEAGPFVVINTGTGLQAWRSPR